MFIHIPSGFFVPIFIASFLISAFVYYRSNPVRRIFTPSFVLMAGAVALIFTAVIRIEPSDVFFLLALAWLGAAIYLLRTMPPPKH